MKVIRNGNQIEFTGIEYVEPLKSKLPVLIAVDPGKTNLAIVIGTVSGRILEEIELSGKGMDTAFYCFELNQYLNKILENTKILEVGQEEAIMPSKEKISTESGYAYFTSQMVLTEVRAILRYTFIQITGNKPTMINNWVWKSSELPEEYRGHGEKGSHRYLVNKGEVTRSKSHDLTDARLMYRYLQKKHKALTKAKCDSNYCVSLSTKAIILDSDKTIESKFQEVEYNYEYSILDNIGYMENYAKNTYCKIDLEKLRIEDIYKYSGVEKYTGDKELVVISD